MSLTEGLAGERRRGCRGRLGLSPACFCSTAQLASTSPPGPEDTRLRSGYDTSPWLRNPPTYHLWLSPGGLVLLDKVIQHSPHLPTRVYPKATHGTAWPHMLIHTPHVFSTPALQLAHMQAQVPSRHPVVTIHAAAVFTRWTQEDRHWREEAVQISRFKSTSTHYRTHTGRSASLGLHFLTHKMGKQHLRLSGQLQGVSSCGGRPCSTSLTANTPSARALPTEQYAWSGPSSEARWEVNV